MTDHRTRQILFTGQEDALNRIPGDVLWRAESYLGTVNATVRSTVIRKFWWQSSGRENSVFSGPTASLDLIDMIERNV